VDHIGRAPVRPHDDDIIRRPHDTAQSLLERQTGHPSLQHGVKLRPVQRLDFDQVFRDLEQQIASLRELNRPDLLSAQAAAASVRRYIAEPRFRIDLQRLFVKEIREVVAYMQRARLSVDHLTPDVARRFVGHYESFSEKMVAMLGAVSSYDDGNNESLITQSIQSPLEARRGGGQQGENSVAHHQSPALPSG